MVVQHASEPSLDCISGVPTLYFLPMEKHELELVTSTCTMSCNVLFLECARQIMDLCVFGGAIPLGCRLSALRNVFVPLL
jgi:hypothetical protein